VCDEVERSVAGGAGSMWATAPLMWLFLAGSGLGLPGWGVGLAIAACGALLSVPAVLPNCRSAWSRPEGIAWPLQLQDTPLHARQAGGRVGDPGVVNRL
jgi:hypothetical protein